MADDRFWDLARLSDQQLLASLHGALRTKRRALAEIIAHLGEVEERRLHLEVACGSLFSYCVQRLGMSEDEACRRIELARLARRFPTLFDELASGRISLSVALLFKGVLSADNHAALLAAARGASLRKARELLAARFPSPDVASQIRKLPERGHTDHEASLTPVAGSPAASPTAPVEGRAASPVAADSHKPALCAPGSERHSSNESSQPSDSSWPTRRRGEQRIEPLSAGRYRVQLTADASLKHKLERARDLMRHTYPDGDFADILSRALDLLITDVMKRRFGARAGTDASTTTLKPATSTAPTAPTAATVGSPAVTAAPPATTPNGARANRRTHITLASRRAVIERDGPGCSWTDADGQRCGSTAWLEIDHRRPAGKGGGSDPNNLRLLCRAHNRHAAEHEYGRRYVERMIVTRQRAPAAARTPP